MLKRDNVVAEGALGLTDLGITPTAVEAIVPGYLTRYRGGGKSLDRPAVGQPQQIAAEGHPVNREGREAGALEPGHHQP
jgi:hypothetical protein